MDKIQATKLHCKLCFDTLLAALKNAAKPQWPKELPDVETPIFVTWKKHGELRGCIGTFSPEKLSKLVPQYALTAALKDPRFDMMKLEEVPNLTVHVSLLVNFQQQKDIYNWEVGKHGVIIKSNFEGGMYSGTFLPEVAKEQGWSREETFMHLVRKAGFYGKFDNIAPTISLTTYESSKESMTYEEYSKWK